VNIIIIIGMTALFEPLPSLEDSARLHSFFAFFYFATVTFLYRARSSALYPTPNLKDPGLRIYVPQCQSGSVIPPGTGFPFHCHLRLAGLRWSILTYLHVGWIQSCVRPIKLVLCSICYVQMHDSSFPKLLTFDSWMIVRADPRVRFEDQLAMP
jgi:hypothetical protein